MNCGENVRVKLVETEVGVEEEVDEGGDAHGGDGWHHLCLGHLGLPDWGMCDLSPLLILAYPLNLDTEK